MIEGLKITIDPAELKALCLARADYHRERARVYAEQEASMTATKIESMSYSGGDPIKALRDKREEHESEAGELDFIALHLANEAYLLDSSALRKLGITKAYW